MMKTQHILFLIMILVWSACSRENWTHFRGNHLDGHAEGSKYPVHFSETENIAWKTGIQEAGWSSPVVWGKQVWITTATPAGNKMSALCLDLESGRIVKDILLFEPDSVQNIHSLNSYASPTPCIEDGFFYAHFGTYGTACINTRDFSVVWRRNDLNCEHMQGAGSSLLLYGNLLILHFDGTDVQFIAALDKKTGATVWKTERPHEFYDHVEPVYRKAYTTPIIINAGGKDQMISNGSQMCISYDPATGKELWSVWYGDDSTVGMPLECCGLVFFNSGWLSPESSSRYVKFFAVDPNGKGDVTNTRVKWTLSEDVPQISTPVIVDTMIYMVHERGALTCVDALTGKIIWKNKLKGVFNASPVYAGGNIYFAANDGTVYIIKPGDQFILVAQNKLDGIIKATPAFVNGSIIIRTSTNIYRILGKSYD